VLFIEDNGQHELHHWDGLVDGPWTLLGRCTAEDGSPMPLLFHHESDRGQTRDLAESRLDEVSKLTQRLNDELSRLAAQAEDTEGRGTRGRDVDPELAEQLRALGYTGE